MGVVAAVPEVAKKALRCRTLGQRINELVGGRGTHPVTSVAGGVTFRLDDGHLSTLRGWIGEAESLAGELAGVARDLLMRQLDLHPRLLTEWTQHTWYMGTVAGDTLNLYDGRLRIIDETGQVRYERESSDYDTLLRESSLDWSYMKPVSIVADGAPQVYRVGPLARLNCAGSTGTPLADEALAAMRASFGRPVHEVVLQVYARVIELLYACERARQIVDDPAITGPTRVPVSFKGGRGVAHVEAPRGTLFHDYTIDEHGIVRAANLIVATQQNYAAINRSIAQAAATHVIGRDDGGLLNAIEFAIRCYDPCLSCATHAVGRMPMEVVVRHHGQILRQVRR